MLAVGIVMAMQSHGLETYVPITGIPTPTFGVTETVDVKYGAGSGKTWDYGSGVEAYRTVNGLPYTHYIDRLHGSATDTANTYGSPATPRLTWPYPLPTGSCVQVHGTGYTFTNSSGSKQAIGGTGTLSDPIFFYGIVGSEPEIPGNSSECYIYGDYCIIEAIKFVSDCSLSTRPLLKGANVVKQVVRDCQFVGTGVSGSPVCVSTGGSSGSDLTHQTEGLVVLRNTASDYGDWQAAGENDSGFAIVSQFATNIWVLDNEAFHFGGDGIRIGADQGDTPSGGFYYVGRNHFHDNRENGIDVKQAENAVLSENILHGFASSSSSNGEAVVIHYDPNNIWFINNTIYDCISGIVCTGIDDDHLYLIGNVLYDCSTRAIYPDRGGGHHHVLNNTIHDSAAGIICTGTVDSLEIRGNIVFDITGNYLQVDNSTVRAASSASNELYFETSGSVAVNWGAAYTTVAAWIAGTVVGDNSVEDNPDFVNAVGRNYRIQATSPAIGSGYNWSALDATFQSSFGVTMLKDLGGTTRPNGAWDMGAYEFSSGGTIIVTGTATFTTLNVGP